MKQCKIYNAMFRVAGDAVGGADRWTVRGHECVLEEGVYIRCICSGNVQLHLH